MKSWVDNRGNAGSVLHELVQCSFLQWMECLFYDCRVSFSDLELTSSLIRISILEGELLYCQRKVFSRNYMYFHLSVSCWNWMQHVHRYQHQFCVALISELCYCVTSCSGVYYSACINIWFCLLKWQIALFIPYINVYKHCSVNKASWVVSNRDWLGKNPYIMGLKKR